MELQEFIAAISGFTHVPPSEADVVEFEQTLGHRLPADYRAFVLASGGGYMASQPSFRWSTGEWAGRVHTVGGLREDLEDYSLPSQWHEPHWKRPHDFLWILRDHGGNPIGLALSGEDAGQVFFLDHEMEPDEEDWDGSLAGAVEAEYLLPLAPSFADFVASVYED